MLATYGFTIYALFAVILTAGFCWQMLKPIFTDVFAYVNNTNSPTPRNKRVLYASIGSTAVFLLFCLTMYSVYLYQHRG